MNDPVDVFLDDRRFSSDGEYMDALFALLDRMLFRDPRSGTGKSVTHPGRGAGTWERSIRNRLYVTRESGGTLSLENVLEKTQAPYYMRMLLAYLVRCALEPGFEREAAAQAGREGPCLYGLCGVFGAPEDVKDTGARFRMMENGRHSLGILFPQLLRRERSTGQSIAGLVPVMDARLLAILMGEGDRAELPQGITLLPGAEETDGEAAAGEQVLSARARSMPPEIAVLWGPPGSGKEILLRRLGAAEGKRAAVLDAAGNTVPGSGTGDEDLFIRLSMLLRECVLMDRVPALRGLELLPAEEQKAVAAFLRERFLPLAGNVYVLMETEEEPDYLPECFFLRMEETKSRERILLWREELPERAEISPEGIESLANTFALTKGQIRSAARDIRRLAGPDGRITEDLIYRVCYAKLGHPLREQTVRVHSPFTWEDLKMSPADKAVLRDICRSARSRHIVMQDWNFERKIPYGAGITALFSGPPGTGKTMAAQVIANELRMELYKIDLSRMIDKYVGETEKNIKRIFDQAAKSNAVLFFDEADAIFNKRLEAGNSNDRFANIESSLLLQCIEEYQGIILLATNNMSAIDAAFLRRFRFYLQFKEPDEAIRYEIWKSVFPAEAPVSPEVDFRELARIFGFTGAVIKNVALQAAYLSAGGECIGMVEIMVAVRRELEKSHRMLTRDDMGSYGFLFPEVIAWGDQS